ncbi:MAG: DUF4920 domain-containing protein [Cyclobacteriaceae bacterium]
MKTLIHNYLHPREIIYFAVLLLAISCSPTKEKGTYYGAEFEVNGAQSIDQLISGRELNQSEGSKNVKLSGVIEEVCQSKGCWMMLKTEDDTKVRVTFKDYAFFVPKDAKGKKIYLTGEASINELDSATLKHYADDAGKPVADMSAVELSIVSEGVLIL